MTEAFNVLINMFNRLFGYLDLLFSELGAWSFVLGFFLIYTIYRLILAPVLGAGRSDMVKKIRNREQVQGVSGLEKR